VCVAIAEGRNTALTNLVVTFLDVEIYFPPPSSIGTTSTRKAESEHAVVPSLAKRLARWSDNSPLAVNPLHRGLDTAQDDVYG
jgi:hypothetical protein